MMQLTDIHTAIATINNLFKEIVNSCDADEMAALYSQDGLALPTNGDHLTDKENLLFYWQSVMELGIRKAIEISEAESNGSTSMENSEDEQTPTITKMDFGLTWD